MIASRRWTEPDAAVDPDARRRPARAAPAPSPIRSSAARCRRAPSAQLAGEAAHGSGPQRPHAAAGDARPAAAAARTSAANSARVRRVVDERLGVPLDAEHEAARPSASMASIVAVRRPGDGVQPGPQPLDRLVVERVDVELARCRAARAGGGAGSTRTACVATQPGCVWRWATEPSTRSGRCWQSVPPRATLSSCMPRQMAEHRQAGGLRVAQRRASSKRSMSGHGRAELGVRVGAVEAADRGPARRRCTGRRAARAAGRSAPRRPGRARPARRPPAPPPRRRSRPPPARAAGARRARSDRRRRGSGPPTWRPR